MSLNKRNISQYRIGNMHNCTLWLSDHWKMYNPGQKVRFWKLIFFLPIISHVFSFPAHTSQIPIHLHHPYQLPIHIHHSFISTTHPSQLPIHLNYPSISTIHPPPLPISTTHINHPFILTTHPSQLPIHLKYPSISTTHPSQLPIHFNHPSISTLHPFQTTHLSPFNSGWQRFSSLVRHASRNPDFGQIREKQWPAISKFHP